MKALARGCVLFTINRYCVFPPGLGFLGGESCQAEEEREAGIVQLFLSHSFLCSPGCHNATICHLTATCRDL